jgi:hypothetical protein
MLLGAAAAASGQAAPQSGRASMDAAVYAAELHQLSERIRLAEPATLSEVVRGVPVEWRVELGSGTVEIPAAWLQQQLRLGAQSPQRWPEIRARLLETLQAAEDEARALSDKHPASDAAPARAALDTVLARPEFAQIARENAMARLQARVLEWLRRWWARLGGDRLAVRSTATVFAWVASLAAFAVLAGWLIHLLRRSSRSGLRFPDPPEPTVVRAEAWARQAATAQDPRESARCAYRAVVRRFEEDGTWKADAARTPREYIRLLPRDHRRRGLVEDVARRFEEIWFAGRTANEEDRGAVLRRLRELGCLPAA